MCIRRSLPCVVILFITKSHSFVQGTKLIDYIGGLMCGFSKCVALDKYEVGIVNFL